MSPRQISARRSGSGAPRSSSAAATGSRPPGSPTEAKMRSVASKRATTHIRDVSKVPLLVQRKLLQLVVGWHPLTFHAGLMVQNPEHLPFPVVVDEGAVVGREDREGPVVQAGPERVLVAGIRARRRRADHLAVLEAVRRVEAAQVFPSQVQVLRALWAIVSVLRMVEMDERSRRRWEDCAFGRPGWTPPRTVIP
jgi:hypothetical protein